MSDILTVENYMAFPPIAADVRLAYGDDDQQFGDLYMPQGAGPHPVLLLLHGGCWRARYGLEPMGKLCRAAAEEGFAVWSLEYRRVGSGGGWPNTFLDVAAGTDFLRVIQRTYPLDLNRVVAMGHSAGGHLVLWLAARVQLPASSELFTENPLPIHGIISLAGIADLVEGARRGICQGGLQAMAGGEPDEAPQKYAQASPHAHLPLGVPQILINGELDSTVPVDYVEQYEAAARSHGDSVRLEVIPEAGHFEVVAADRHAWPVIRQALHELAGLQ